MPPPDKTGPTGATGATGATGPTGPAGAVGTQAYFLVGYGNSRVPEIQGPFTTAAAAAAKLGNLNANTNVLVCSMTMVQILQGAFVDNNA